MIKVAFFGYRDWAKEIKSNLIHAGVKFVSLKEADVVLYYGWSKLIPAKIYRDKLCLILHPSPLPKYRGGSPLQHQIIKGETRSAVTICEVIGGLDAGYIYSQTPFSLKGTLDDIFQRIIDIGTRDTIKVLEMIKNNVKPKPQKGEPTVFKRRKPQDSELLSYYFDWWTSKELYNFIRALSSSTEDYPDAFIKCSDGKKLYFTGVHL